MHQYCYRIKLLFAFLTAFLGISTVLGKSGTADEATCPMVHITPERLPDMNTPRAGHSLFVLNGELTVFGGHTLGFVPTPTAEYFSNGQWHQLPMVYPHDDGISVAMRSGKVLLAGGHAEPLGIGQSFMVEWYDPTSHTFEGFGCLDTKRAIASALELDSGKVVISGNHYNRDAIEMFDGKKLFYQIKEVSTERIVPFILRIAPDDAVILSSENTRLQRSNSDFVDRVKGDSFRAPILQKWHPRITVFSTNNDDGFIGDEQSGNYVHLFPVYNDSLQMAIMELRDTVFSLLPTVSPLPFYGIEGDTISYETRVIADRKNQRAYLEGVDIKERHYFAVIDYSQQPAPITVYYTDPLPECGLSPFVLTPEGNLIVCGGLNYGHGESVHDNYAPLPTAWLFRFAPNETTAGTETAIWISGWPWIAAALLLLAVIAVILLRRKRTRRSAIPTTMTDTTMDSEATITPEETIAAIAPYEALMQRIRELMTEQQLFKQSELKVADVAALLGTNVRYVSDCINQLEGRSFSQFVNSYRIDYAKQQLRQQPDVKLTALSLESGFANETSFFRAFKSLTGMTPREWLAQTD